MTNGVFPKFTDDKATKYLVINYKRDKETGGH